MTGASKKSRAAVTRAVKNLYRSISFRDGDEPDLNGFEELMHPGARLIHVTADGAETLTVTQFTKRFRKRVKTRELRSFREEQLNGSLEIFGGIAHMLSTYAAHIELDTTITTTRGINSIQLLRDGDKWWVASIIWYDETGREPIPLQYLPDNERSIK